MKTCITETRNTYGKFFPLMASNKSSDNSNLLEGDAISAQQDVEKHLIFQKPILRFAKQQCASDQISKR